MQPGVNAKSVRQRRGWDATTIRGLLRGETVTHPGAMYSVDELTMPDGDRPDVPLFWGAKCPRMSLEALEDFAHRCDDLGIRTSGIHYFDQGASARVDVQDPDGTAIRFHIAPGRPPFMGVSSSAGGEHEVYNRPSLQGLPVPH